MFLVFVVLMFVVSVCCCCIHCCLVTINSIHYSIYLCIFISGFGGLMVEFVTRFAAYARFCQTGIVLERILPKSACLLVFASFFLPLSFFERKAEVVGL